MKLTSALPSHSSKNQETLPKYFHKLATSVIFGTILKKANARSDEEKLKVDVGKLKHRVDFVLDIRMYNLIDHLIGVLLERKDYTMLYLLCFAARENLHTTIQHHLKWTEKIKNSNEKGKIEKQSLDGIRWTNNRQLFEYINELNINMDRLVNSSSDRPVEILVVGGGESPLLSQIEEFSKNIKVTNVDPLYTNFNYLNESVKFPFNFLSPEAKDMVKKCKFSEVWAYYSLPTYAFFPSDIIDFYRNALISLNEEGVLRVFPADHFDITPKDFHDGAKLLCKEAVGNTLHNINLLMKSRVDLFKIESFSRGGKGPYGTTSVAGLVIQLLKPISNIYSFFDELDIDDLSSKFITPASL